MIEVKNLDVFYGKTEVLKNINFSLKRGEIICILGENGSGKSTLLKSLLKLIPIKNGEISVEEENLKNFDNKKLSKVISYIPQSHFPSFDYNVVDVILMGNYSKKKGMFFKITKEDTDRVLEILKSLGIEHLKTKNYRQISGGERQLVLIARALLQANNYIFMDEPVANLDFGNQVKIMEICSSLKKKEIGFLITTHNPNHALSYADKVLIVQKNKETFFGNTFEILNKKRLEDLYGISIDIIDYDGNRVCIPKYREK
ncbi:MAG: ABC transporter ATP-binding protein [Parvimonas sp.]|uniref:ABC transporter ATP-binding protein n=1 Tax=Parvimonas sp. TaxID=1944660 RepID=UPI0025DDE9CA|nr:ABC transporter ATP-binding protein [Parvimonas sp.]MCI5996866.1 ABC transporter ATP-binding protein [Parvimonas sp.]MDY3050511.1 ABC transporter ATP-binding protein [Parvimonas sp.]